MRSLVISWGLLLASVGASFAQNSVDVTFRYYAQGQALRAYVPGEFNGWDVSVNSPALMRFDTTNGFWYKKISLDEDGGTGNIDGENAYQYKFNEHLSSDGSDNSWYVDPINPNSMDDGNGNINSIVRVEHPMVFQIQPAPNTIVNEETTEIWANVAARSSDSIDVATSNISLNGQQISTFEGYYEGHRQLLHVESLNAIGGQLREGENTLKVTAVTKSGAMRVDSTTFTFMPPPVVVDQERPQGLQDGITYSPDGTSATLSLFAPHKDYVHVIGDFNDWKVGAEFVMKRDSVNADSVWYWLTIKNLQPGREYGFQYLVDGELRVADPYAEKILLQDDQFISDLTYPNLKPYPDDKTDFAVGVLQPGKPKYSWEVTDFKRPHPEELVIYELLVRDFVGKHNYATLIDTLGYLDKLGVNAIELMPVMEFEGNNSWGYNSAFHFAPDKYYGPGRDLKRFIDACHQRGIAVILDVVLNHVYGQSSMVRLWNEGDYGRPTPENPYMNVESPNQTFSFGYDFNHESKATQYYVDRVTRYWLEEFNIDGYRFDFTKGLTQKPGDGWAYDASRIRILERMADKQWSVDSTSYVILEHFAENSEEVELSNYGMMLWGKMTDPYNEATMGYNENGKSDLSGIYFKARNWSMPHLVGYMESHDEERLMFKNLEYGNRSGSYDVTELPTALNRMKAAGAFFFTIPGPKMIWQFGELGYDYSINYNGRLSPKPIRWDYYDQVNRRNLYKTWSALMRLRESDPVFGDDSTNAQYSLGGSVKRLTLEHPESGTQAVVMGNFGVTANSSAPYFPDTGKWYDFFSGDSVNVTNPTEPLTLEPGEFHIWTTRRFMPPEDNILVDISDETWAGIPQKFKLHQNYPNPFNPATQIRYDVAEAATVTIEVYDMLGRKVATLIDGVRKKAGSYSLRFDAGQLGSGIYFARMQAGSRIMTRKMLLLK